MTAAAVSSLRQAAALLHMPLTSMARTGTPGRRLLPTECLLGHSMAVLHMPLTSMARMMTPASLVRGREATMRA